MNKVCMLQSRCVSAGSISPEQDASLKALMADLSFRTCLRGTFHPHTGDFVSVDSRAIAADQRTKLIALLEAVLPHQAVQRVSFKLAAEREFLNDPGVRVFHTDAANAHLLTVSAVHSGGVTQCYVGDIPYSSKNNYDVDVADRQFKGLGRLASLRSGEFLLRNKTVVHRYHLPDGVSENQLRLFAMFYR